MFGVEGVCQTEILHTNCVISEFVKRVTMCSENGPDSSDFTLLINPFMSGNLLDECRLDLTYF